MARENLMEFKHNGRTIKVYTGESSSDVYYSNNGGSSTSTGLSFNSNLGKFTATSGSSLTFEEAKGYIRARL